MSAKHRIDRDDIVPLETYGPERPERRRAIIAYKRPRRQEVGPFAAFYFENYTTMLSQIQEMLWIEKGGEEQLADELAAYNPLIPQGQELVATLMFEIDNPEVRARFLSGLGGVEETTFFDLDGEVVEGVPEEDVNRTNADGKASSVQFLHFPFSADQIDKFKNPDTRIMLGIEHEKYAHAVILPPEVRDALAADFAD